MKPDKEHSLFFCFFFTKREVLLMHTEFVRCTTKMLLYEVILMI